MASNEFTIIAGAHRGAAFCAGSDLLVIGSDAGCDVRLSDPGLAPRHAAVVSQQQRVSIRQLDGTVRVNGQPLPASGSVTLDVGAEIVLGECGVRLRFGATTAATTKSARSSRRRSRPSRTIALAVLVTCTLLVASFSPPDLDASGPEVSGPTAVESVRAVLRQEHLENEVELSATPDGARLEGVIPREAAARLRTALAAQPIAIVDAITTDAELIEQVRDVFRTHGYDAQITYLGAARVRIDNLDEDHERVRHVATLTRTDVPQLAALSFAATGSLTPPTQPPHYRNAPGVTLSAHVDADIAYLAASDGGRYFVGSVLPSGHRVRRITSGAVQVDRNGQIAWFRF
jgi:type III secretion protein D